MGRMDSDQPPPRIPMGLAGLENLRPSFFDVAPEMGRNPPPPAPVRKPARRDPKKEKPKNPIKETK